MMCIMLQSFLDMYKAHGCGIDTKVLTHYTPLFMYTLRWTHLVITLIHLKVDMFLNPDIIIYLYAYQRLILDTYIFTHSIKLVDMFTFMFVWEIGNLLSCLRLFALFTLGLHTVCWKVITKRLKSHPSTSWYLILYTTEEYPNKPQ